MERLCLLIAATLVAALLPATVRAVPGASSGSQHQSSAAPGDEERATYSRLPLRFEPNHGQVDSRVQFTARGRGYTLFLAGSESVVALPPAAGAAGGGVVRMQLVGAQPGDAVGSERLGGVTNYLTGSDEDRWITDVPAYAKVTLPAAYPGIDVVYYGTEEQELEYDFVVGPGADPGQINVRFEGHDRLTLDPDGALAIVTPAGTLRQSRPVVYQDIGGVRRRVEGSYRVDADKVGFVVGAYDPTVALVIDPVLSYSTFLGSGLADEGNAIAVSRAGGYAYVAGKSCSTDFPVTTGSYDSTPNGACDAFVAKFATGATGASSLVYATYLGGKAPGPPPEPAPSSPQYVEPTSYVYPNGTGGDDKALGIAVDEEGRVFLTGETTSDDFPTSDTAYDRFCGTRNDRKCFYSTHQRSNNTLTQATIYVYFASDAFVTVLDPAGSGLVYSTYLGGSTDSPNTTGPNNSGAGPIAGGVDSGRAIATDGSGKAYVTGSTTSPDFATATNFSKRCVAGKCDNSPSDAFLVAIDANGAGASSLSSAMLSGGPQEDFGAGIAVDGGNVYIAGQTSSPPAQGASDAFIAGYRVASGGAIEGFGSTYFGAGVPGGLNNREAGTAVAVAPGGEVYLTGSTDSGDLPRPDGGPPPVQPDLSGPGQTDGFIASFHRDLHAMLHMTYLGGPGGPDVPTGLAVTNASVVVTGWTDSVGFPVEDALQESSGGAGDAFVARLTADLSSLEWSTYLGGGPTPATVAHGEDRARGLAVDDAGDAYVAGTTVSKDFPTAEPFQDELAGNGDAFVARISAPRAGVPSVRDLWPEGGPPGTTVVISGDGFGPGSSVYFGDLPATSVTVDSQSQISAVSPVPDDHAPDSVAVSVRSATVSPQGSRARYTYQQGSWEPTVDGSLSFGGATFTVLGGPNCGLDVRPLYCGRVLVAGGAQGLASTTSRLYDPKLEAWSPAACAEPGPLCPAPLNLARAGHTATALPSGKVLVVGAGLGFPNATTAEVYDPEEGTWTRTGDLSFARAGHTATLLGGSGCAALCGKVLVAGGTLVPAPAELYDPEAGPTALDEVQAGRAGGWTPTGQAIDRQWPTATPLPEGGVLLVGGLSGGQDQSTKTPTSAVALFQPASGTWADGPPITVPRARHSATLLHDGKVLVAGGHTTTCPACPPNPVSSAELYDPGAADPAWTFTASLAAARYSHMALLLPSGNVLVTSGDTSLPPSGRHPEATAELYQPSGTEGMAGRFRPAGRLPRNYHEKPASAVVVLGSGADGTAADPTVCGTFCGKVLLGAELDSESHVTEIYTPPPWVRSVSPPTAPVSGGAVVTIAGGGFSNESSVLFGRQPATTTFVAWEELRAVVPRGITALTPIRVAETRVGVGVAREPFRYTGPPGRVVDLSASAASDTQVDLTFSAAGAVEGTGAPISSYVIKQARSEITPDTFDAALSICDGGTCGFKPAFVGQPLRVAVPNRQPGTEYFYALKGRDGDGALGEMSNLAQARTSGVAPVDDSGSSSIGGCPAVAAPVSGQVLYPAGHSLVGLPPGTVVASRSPLYSWFDQGGGGEYQVQAASQPTEAGRGYWAWHPCPLLVAMAGVGLDSVHQPLGGYRASMVGNPSGLGPAAVSGHDFAARWDPLLNAGAGGYHLSGYREAQQLAVGDGTWVFSYVPTQVRVTRR